MMPARSSRNFGFTATVFLVAGRIGSESHGGARMESSPDRCYHGTKRESWRGEDSPSVATPSIIRFLNRLDDQAALLEEIQHSRMLLQDQLRLASRFLLLSVLGNGCTG